MGLAALLILSFSMNIAQCGNSNKEGDKSCTVDTTVFIKRIEQQDSIIKEKDTDLKKIEKLASGISSDNISPVDSIKKIVRNNIK